MQPRFILRRRPSTGEALPDFNAALVAKLMTIPELWRPGVAAEAARFRYDGEFGTLDLRKPLQRGLVGQIFYERRVENWLGPDEGSSDDHIRLVFYPEKVSLPSLCLDLIPALIAAFDAYRADLISNPELSGSEWMHAVEESKVTGKIWNRRHDVDRIWPVFYADDLLCRRAFGLEPAEIVRRAAPGCERAEIVCGGAYLVVTTDLVTDLDGLDAIDTRIRTLLGLPPRKLAASAVRKD